MFEINELKVVEISILQGLALSLYFFSAEKDGVTKRIQDKVP